MYSEIFELIQSHLKAAINPPTYSISKFRTKVSYLTFSQQGGRIPFKRSIYLSKMLAHSYNQSLQAHSVLMCENHDKSDKKFNISAGRKIT